MNKNINFLFSICILILVVSCGPRIPKSEVLPTSGGDCPLEKRNWMKVTTTYDKTQVVNAAVKLGAAATADSKLLKKIASGNANFSVGDSLTKTINEITKDSMEVSQEFYENFQTQRSSLCNLMAFAKNSAFKNDKDFIKRLQDEYFKIGESFIKVKTDEEKKNP